MVLEIDIFFVFSVEYISEVSGLVYKDHFVANIWYGHDANMDDKISYEEFIHIHNTILDRWK